MFKDVEARFVLRASFAAILAGLSASSVALTDGSVSLVEGITIASATLTVLGTYMGVGAAVPQVEPNIGNKMEE